MFCQEISSRLARLLELTGSKERKVVFAKKGRKNNNIYSVTFSHVLVGVNYRPNDFSVEGLP